jgi:peptidyl-prolyl cis-trans isomerase SurA
MAASCGKPPAPKPLSPDVWAVVDGREISRADVETAYKATITPTPTPPSDEEAMGLKLNLLDELIAQDILLARSKAQGLEASDADVDKAVTERKGALTDEGFQQQLTDRGMTLADLKVGLHRELSVQKLLEKEVTSAVNVSEADITAYYNQNRAQFDVPEMSYRVAQIVVTPVKDPQVRNRKGDDATTPVDAQRKASMLVDRLRAGDDFAALAMDYSEDPNTAPQGGDLGLIPQSGLNRAPAQLRDAVVKTEPGRVTMLTINGAPTILLVIAREPAGQRDLDTPGVHDGIRDDIRNRKEQLLRSAYIAAARADAHVVNHLAQELVSSHGALPGK